MCIWSCYRAFICPPQALHVNTALTKEHIQVGRSAMNVMGDVAMHSGATPHHTTPHHTTPHHTTRHNPTKHHTTQHSITQHNTTQHKTQHNTTQDTGHSTQHTAQHNRGGGGGGDTAILACQAIPWSQCQHCGVVWCGVVWCGVPKALLPKGKGRDVYPRVQVNGRAVCVVCVLCASVFRKGRRAGRGRPGGSPPGYRS